MESPFDEQRYLSQQEATELDEELMGPLCAYSIDQLMELAGLSVAQAIFDCQPPANNLTNPQISCEGAKTKVIVIAGPGNNGGDGLVAARHLKQFGYDVDVWYPRQGKNDIYNRLVLQLEYHRIPVLRNSCDELESYHIIVDAIFGFNFSGETREPYKEILKIINKTKAYIVSVDIPSGWNVETGDVNGDGLRPNCLVSLSAPKMCARLFNGLHYVGGRFIPSKLIHEKLGLRIPYKGSDQVVMLSTKIQNRN